MGEFWCCVKYFGIGGKPPGWETSVLNPSSRAPKSGEQHQDEARPHHTTGTHAVKRRCEMEQEQKIVETNGENTVERRSDIYAVTRQSSQEVRTDFLPFWEVAFLLKEAPGTCAYKHWAEAEAHVLSSISTIEDAVTGVTFVRYTLLFTVGRINRGLNDA